MMDVEDLIASMHVGKEGYELKALQAHLSRTLGYHSEGLPPYQPVQGVQTIPAAPVSSLNSMASTSYNIYPSSYQTNSNHLPPMTNKAIRPQCTPAHSFRGFQPPTRPSYTDHLMTDDSAMNNDMDCDMMDTDDHPTIYNHLQYPSQFPASPPETDDQEYGAFSSDAFAPSYARPYSSGDSQDAWSAFKKDNASGQRMSAFNNSPVANVNKGQGFQAPNPTIDARFGLPTPPDETPSPTQSRWAGRLRDTKARDQRNLVQHGFRD